MKKFLLIAMAGFAMTLASCSGSGSGKSALFGSLPSEYANMMAESDKLIEEAKNIKTAEDKQKLIEKSQKMDEKWSAKLEKTAKSLDGKEITLVEDFFKVTEPISLTFEELVGNDLEPRFRVNGSAETIESITIESGYLAYRTVYIAGYDAEGNEVFKSDVGSVKGTFANNVLEIPAGTEVEFTTLSFNDSYVDKYPEAKTLKLIM